MSKILKFLNRLKKDKKIFQFVKRERLERTKFPRLIFYIVEKNRIFNIRFFEIFKYRITFIRIVIACCKLDFDVCFMQGKSKIVLLNDKIVKYLYLDNATYLKAKENYKNYSDKFPYNFAEIFDFNDTFCSATSRRLYGNVRNDYESNLNVISYLIKNVSSTKILLVNQLPVLCTIQHGDAHFGNVIWLDNNQFAFCDLDFIGYKPLFYDVIHYVASTIRSKDFILELISKNFTFLKELYSNFKEIHSCEELQKEIINAYIIWFKIKTPQLIKCYDFLED